MMAKAMQTASRFNDSASLPWIQQLFESIQRLQGAGRLLKRIATSSDANQFADYFAEVTYALVFAGLGFNITIEPLGAKGPDLEVGRDGHKAVVEITRFRHIFPGPPELNENSSILPNYGNSIRDIRKSLEKIESKFRQVGDEPSIIALWNDDGDLEEYEVATAVACLRNNENKHILSLPQGLLFIVYASQWVRLPSPIRQIYCFPIRGYSKPCYSSWQDELNASTVKPLLLSAISKW